MSTPTIPWPSSDKKIRSRFNNCGDRSSKLSSKKKAERPVERRKSMAETFSEVYNGMMADSPVNRSTNSRKSVLAEKNGSTPRVRLSFSRNMSPILIEDDDDENIEPKTVPKKKCVSTGVRRRTVFKLDSSSSSDSDFLPLAERIGIKKPAAKNKKKVAGKLDYSSSDSESPKINVKTNKMTLPTPKSVDFLPLAERIGIKKKTDIKFDLPNLNAPETPKTTKKLTMVLPKSSSSDSLDSLPKINTKRNGIRSTGKKKCKLEERRINLISSDEDDEESFVVNPRPKQPIKLPDLSSDDDAEQYSFTKPTGTPLKERLYGPKAALPKDLFHSKVHQFRELKDIKDVNYFLLSLSKESIGKPKHPDAVYYCINFSSCKEQLTVKLYAIFNQYAFKGKLDPKMTLDWKNRMTSTAGYCYYKRNTVNHNLRSASISLSIKILDSADRLRDTLIHEMCHAATWVISGQRDIHGSVWKQWCGQARCAFPALPPITRCHHYEIVTKFQFRCSKCAAVIGRHSKSIDIHRKCCGKCGGRFEILKDGKLLTPAPVTPSRVIVPTRVAPQTAPAKLKKSKLVAPPTMGVLTNVLRKFNI